MRFLLTLSLLCLASPSLATPKVLVSIAPIHSLVSSLTKGISEPGLLLPQGGSPHSASLKPSQAQALATADLMIWVGPELESFLTVPIGRLVAQKAEMRLLKLKNLKLLPQRHGGFWEEDQHENEASHDHQSINPHIWLSPNNARQIAKAVCRRLVEIDPQNAKAYQQNLAALTLRIDQLQQKLQRQLMPIQNRPYLVFHDAYPYLEDAFSLNAIGSIRISAERAPGARRLQQISAKINQSAAVCLFTEPQFSPAIAKALTAGQVLKLGVLDPLGSRSTHKEEAWFDLMNALADNLVECLKVGP